MTWVSDADKAAEAMIVDRLAKVRPDDGIIGEEGAAAPGRRTWVIDPVDGTYNFVSGLPAWCSALALIDGEHLILGAIYQATTDELWLGGRDLPATLNGEQLPALPDRELGEVAISTYLHPTGSATCRCGTACCGPSPAPRRFASSAPARWNLPPWPPAGWVSGCTRTRRPGTGCPARRW